MRPFESEVVATITGDATPASTTLNHLDHTVAERHNPRERRCETRSNAIRTAKTGPEPATYTPNVSHSESTRAVLIPVKAFSDAKARLADALGPTERAALAQSMAENVIAAAAPLPVWIVCDNTEVAAWATRMGANVLWKPDRGLNGAVNEGVADLAHLDIDIVIVAHADLPHAENLGWLADAEGVTLVPDRHQDGTNVIVIPTDSGFVFSYGPASFARHQAEAERRGLPLRIVHDHRLAWDVDRPEDLSAPTWNEQP